MLIQKMLTEWIGRRSGWYTRAELNPNSPNSAAKPRKTATMPTRPKSSGTSRRARMTDSVNWITCWNTRAAVLQARPATVRCFKDIWSCLLRRLYGEETWDDAGGAGVLGVRGVPPAERGQPQSGGERDGFGVLPEVVGGQIGRASCRERVSRWVGGRWWWGGSA